MRKILLGILLAGVVVCGWRAWTRSKLLKTQIAEQTTADDASAALIPVEDWPRWRGPRSDGISRETRLAESWPADGPKRLWSAKVGIGFSSPVASAGRVYLFSLNNQREALTAFDARTGHILWNEESDSGWVGGYPGTRAAPTIDGDCIYTFGATGELICRDLATGAQRWHVNIIDAVGTKPLQWACASSPRIIGNLLYVQGGQKGPIAIAVIKQSGQMAWQSEARGAAGYAEIVVADVAGTPQLAVFGGDAVWGMDPQSGRTLWREPYATDHGVNSSTPVCSDEKLFVTSAYGMGSALLQLSPTGAKRVWTNKKAASKFQGGVLDDGYLYLNNGGRLTCLQWSDGAVQWQRADIDIGEHGSFVRAADKLLCLGSTGELLLLRASPRGAEILAQAKAFDGDQIWSTPLLYGGRVYVKGVKEFACFDVATPSAATQPSVAKR